MIGKFILTILVAMTINMSVDRPLGTDLWTNDGTAAETDYSDAAYSDDTSSDESFDSEKMDLLYDLAINGADQIGAATSAEKIEAALTEITQNSDLEIQYAYYGSKEGAFYIYPVVELPEDYDFRERAPYLNTMDEEIYYAEPYTDLTTNRQIQTICITVYDEKGIIGVFGIDAYMD